MLLQTSATLRWTLVVVAPTPNAGTSIFIASTVDPVATPIPTGLTRPNGYDYSSPGVYRSGSKVNAGAIAGGVVGSLAVVAIAMVALYWIRRRYPKRCRVETENMSAPPQYNMSPSDVGAIEQPAYVYRSEVLGAEEGRELVGDKKHVETWPVDKKM